MTADADPGAALCGYLATVPDVTGRLVNGQASLFSPKLPDDEKLTALGQAMPSGCVVVTASGGYGRFGASLVPIGDPRLELRCYGVSGLDADRIARACLRALRALRTGVWEGVRIMSARVEAGPLPLIDPDTDWPYSLLTAQIVHCEASLV